MFWLSVQQARQLGHVVPQFVGFEEDPLKVPLTLRTLGGVKMTPSAINAFVTQKIEKIFFKKLQIK